MSFIIKLQHLARQARAADIRSFFSGLSIPSGAVCIVGGDSGEAFIGFETDEDARLAMLRSGQPLCQQAVELSLSSRKEMNTAMEEAKKLSRLVQNISKPPDSQPLSSPSFSADVNENSQASSSAPPTKLSSILGTTDTNWTAFLEQALERIEKAKDAPIGHQSAISFGSPSVLGHKPAEKPVVIEQLPTPQTDNYSVYRSTEPPAPKFEPPSFYGNKSLEAGYGREKSGPNFGESPSFAPPARQNFDVPPPGRFDPQRPQDNSSDRFGPPRPRYGQNQPNERGPPRNAEPNFHPPRPDRNQFEESEIRTIRHPDHFGRPNQPGGLSLAPPADPEHREGEQPKFPLPGARNPPFERNQKPEGRGFFGAPRVGLDRQRNQERPPRNDGNRFGEAPQKQRFDPPQRFGFENKGRNDRDNQYAQRNETARFAGREGQGFGHRERNGQEYGQRDGEDERFGHRDREGQGFEPERGPGPGFGQNREFGQKFGQDREYGQKFDQKFGQRENLQNRPFQRPNQENDFRNQRQNPGRFPRNGRGKGRDFPRRNDENPPQGRGRFDGNAPFSDGLPAREPPQIWADKRIEERTHSWNQPPPVESSRYLQPDKFPNSFDPTAPPPRNFDAPPPFADPPKPDMTPEMLEMLRIQQQAMAALNAPNIPQHVDPEELFVELSRLPPNLEDHQNLKGFLGIPVELKSTHENGVLIHTIVKCTNKEDARRLIQRDGELGIKIRWSDRRSFEGKSPSPSHPERKRRMEPHDTPVPSKIPENQSWKNSNREKAGNILLLNVPYKSNEREVMNYLRVATVYNVDLKQVCEPNYTRSDAWVVTVFDAEDLQKLHGHRGTIDGRNVRVFNIPPEMAEALLSEGIRDRKKLDEELRALPKNPPRQDPPTPQPQQPIPSLLSLAPAVINQPPRQPPASLPRPNGRPPMFFGHQPAIHHKFSRNKRDSGGPQHNFDEESTSNDNSNHEPSENQPINDEFHSESIDEPIKEENDLPKVTYASFDQPSKVESPPPENNNGQEEGGKQTEDSPNPRPPPQQYPRPQFGRGRGRGRRNFDNNRGRRLY
ncbi:unnamed protein product [Bursaphelenchus xylophilus]|uniref:(pine wood nematode) hypothetical protein n=1 Tax=Bursaphelenchus xylophilus TaxID=6326 RepID=A0A1I7SA69_BURXY|nr:unnamed protein product [Bursaphelenchus xylophilus]CAG9131861.1 unnamed protein product [Bursaphelenchus xylophilus]